MDAIRRHLAALGPSWTHWTALPLMAYPPWVVFGRGQLRWEWIAFFFVVPLCAFGARWSRKLYMGLLPIAIVPVVYDAMGSVKYLGMTPESVHVCDLRGYELALFGVGSGSARMTLQDFFLVHRSDLADLYFAIPYGGFIAIQIIFAIYLYTRSREGFLRYGWTFLFLNLTGFLTYHIYPSAPPWYYHQTHSCLADFTTHASPGSHLANVDRIVGVPYFASFYGRSSDVYGAVPSLHIAYPILIMIEGWPILRVAGRSLTVVFWASMTCAAVYLDHHYVIDIVMGILYTAAIYPICRVAVARFGRAPTPVAATNLAHGATV
jgi:hypothetical protein